MTIARDGPMGEHEFKKCTGAHILVQKCARAWKSHAAKFREQAAPWDTLSWLSLGAWQPDLLGIPARASKLFQPFSSQWNSRQQPLGSAQSQPPLPSSQPATATRLNDSIRSPGGERGGGLILIFSAATKDPPGDWGKDAFWLTSASEHLLPCEWSQQWRPLPKQNAYTFPWERRWPGE